MPTPIEVLTAAEMAHGAAATGQPAPGATGAAVVVEVPVQPSSSLPGPTGPAKETFVEKVEEVVQEVAHEVEKVVDEVFEAAKTEVKKVRTKS